MDAKKSRHIVAWSAAMLFSSVMGIASASAAPRDYRFEAAPQTIRVSPEAVLTVRLIHIPSGKGVADAVILKSRLEMSMLELRYKDVPMARPMVEDVEFLERDGQGSYRFLGSVSMPGTWTLRLSARVPDEATPIRARVTFKAMRDRSGAPTS